MISILNTMVDEDGRQLVRPTITQAGGSIFYGGPHYVAAQPNSNMWNEISPMPPFTMTDRGWVTYTLYDSTGSPTTIETDAMYSVVSIRPTVDYDILGGKFSIPDVLPTGSGGEWRTWAFAAPNVPASLGGATPLVEDVMLSTYYENSHIYIDGRAPKFLRALDLSNVPYVQYAAGLNTHSSVSATLNDYLTSIGYDGTQHASGDLIVLNIADPDTELWLSYKHNGGTTGTASDFDVGLLNYGWWENEFKVIIKHPTGLSPSTISTDIARFQIELHMYVKWA